VLGNVLRKPFHLNSQLGRHFDGQGLKGFFVDRFKIAQDQCQVKHSGQRRKGHKFEGLGAFVQCFNHRIRKEP